MSIWRTDLASGIRKHGFRKWYERELIASHAHLVLTFLCMVGLFAAFEVYDRRAAVGDQVTDAVAIVLCAAIGVWALRRYLYLLLHAETMAHQAVCPQCTQYARLDVAPASNGAHGTHRTHAQTEAEADAESVLVRCRGCSHCWTILN